MRYNTKSYEKIQDTEFCCPMCLTEELLDSYLHLREFECIDLIANADVITEVLRVLLNSELDGEEFTLGMVNIDGVYADYLGEYIMSINEDKKIWIEPAWREIKGEMQLFDTEAYITYIHGDCDSKILQKLDRQDKNVMIFDFENEE